MTYEEFTEKVSSVILTESGNCPVTPVIRAFFIQLCRLSCWVTPLHIVQGIAYYVLLYCVFCRGGRVNLAKH